MNKDYIFVISEFQGEPCLFVKNTKTNKMRIIIQPCALDYKLDLNEIADILNRELKYIL